MKIITEDTLYVQKRDLAKMLLFNQFDPHVIQNLLGDNFSPLFERDDKYEFIVVKDKQLIEYLKRANWIIDYSWVKDVSDDDLYRAARFILRKKTDIETQLHRMDANEQSNNLNLYVQCWLLDYEQFTLKEFMLFKRGELPITLPSEIDYPKDYPGQKFNLKKTLKRLFKHKKNDKK